MTLQNTIKTDFDTSDELINSYYDKQLNTLQEINIEADMALSENYCDLVYKKCFDNFKITNSIKLTKIRAKEKSQILVQKILSSEDYKNKTLIVNFNSVLLKCINKLLSSLFLNINRNNSK